MESYITGVLVAIVTAGFSLTGAVALGWMQMQSRLAVLENRVKTIEKNVDSLFEKSGDHDEKFNQALERINNSINDLKILIEQNKK